MKNYFKKFSVMFVMSMVLALGFTINAFADDNGVVGTSNLNGTAQNSAKVGDKLILPEIGWMRYDDSNSNIMHSFPIETQSSWYYSNTASCYGNTITSTSYGKNSKNEYFAFNFHGTKLRIISPTFLTSTSSINIYIDNVLVGNFNETANNGSSYISNNIIFKDLVYEITGLSSSNHSVKMVNEDSTGNYFCLDAIDIDKDGYLVNPNESISLDKSSINLNVNNSQQLTATATPAGVGVTWSSSDSTIATVDSNGKVTAVKEGQAIITATTTDGSNLSSACTVTVTNPITPGITLNKTSDSLTIEQTDNLVVTTTPANAQVTWSSSDSSIATVDSTGKVTAIKAGAVTITASTSGGITTTCTVTIANTAGGNTTPTNPTDNSGGTSTGTDGTTNIVNIAHAKGDNTNNAGGEVSIIFNGLPDTTLSVVKTADVKSVYVGDTFTYTIVVTNTGSKTAKAVVINDSAPTHIQFMPSGITTTQGTVDSSSTSSNILVNVGDIPPLGTVTIKMPATVIL